MIQGDRIEVQFCAWYYLTINPIHKTKSGCGDLITGQKTHHERYDWPGNAAALRPSWLTRRAAARAKGKHPPRIE